LRITRTITALVAAVGAVLLALLAAVSAGAATGSAMYSPEEAGFVATGANFQRVYDRFTLPDASQFASNVGSFSLSLTLRSTQVSQAPELTVVLGISTCTTITCTAGGTPAVEPWNAALAVFNSVTHQLVCSNGNSPPMAAGDVVSERVRYDRDTGYIYARVFDTFTGRVFRAHCNVGFVQKFGEARVGAEFATDPWSTAPYNAPASVTPLATLGHVWLTSYSGHKAGLISWWTRQKLFWTRNGLSTGAVNAAPSSLFDSGHAFTVNLLP
jgi:hypothetical protein